MSYLISIYYHKTVKYTIQDRSKAERINRLTL